MDQVYIGDRQNNSNMINSLILFSALILASCSKSSSSINTRTNIQETDTIYSKKNWYTDNYVVSDRNNNKHVEKRIEIYSDVLLLQWDEKSDDVIGKTYSNRKVSFNSSIFDFDKEYYQLYKRKAPEDLGFVSKDLIIAKKDNHYNFNLILYYFACIEECYNYEAIEYKIYLDKSLQSEIKIKEYISKQGIPQI